MSYNWQSASTPQGRERLKDEYLVLFQKAGIAVEVFVNYKKVGQVLWVQDKEHYGFFTNMQSYLMLLPRDFKFVMDAVYNPAIERYKALYGEFLDPEPPQPKDENGLMQTILSLPDDTSAAYIKSIIHDQLKRA